MLHDRFRAERILSRWRVRPSLGESVESYFARLVADNDVGCTPTRFAQLAGLGSSGDPNMLMLEAVSKLPLTPEEMQSLKHWTPTEWKKRTFDLGPESSECIVSWAADGTASHAPGTPPITVSGGTSGDSKSAPYTMNPW